MCVIRNVFESYFTSQKLFFFFAVSVIDLLQVCHASHDECCMIAVCLHTTSK